MAELVRDAAVAAERARMARDLHDVIAGQLSAIALQSEAALTLVEVLVLTMFDLDDYVDAALAAGAAGFLLKSVEAPRLLDAVRAVARGDGARLPRPGPVQRRDRGGVVHHRGDDEDPRLPGAGGDHRTGCWALNPASIHSRPSTTNSVVTSGTVIGEHMTLRRRRWAMTLTCGRS
jgi:DNA-binding response OmpR family regulator